MFTPFIHTLKTHQITLQRKAITTLQVNIGKRCNQACSHCHVESSPLRKENMSLKTVNRLLELLEHAADIITVDITGGAPEMNLYFTHFVKALRQMNKKVIDRCNLTILQERGYEKMAMFLRDHQVQIVASLPCYLKDNLESQRGKGVFDKSILSLQQLNNLGYGRQKELVLNLVYNPTNHDLPREQNTLEKAYKEYLHKHFGIVFNQLFTITNMPIKRYLWSLQRAGKFQEYMNLLINSFNPNIAHHVMCTNLVSISWDGQIYDCDFNQMLDMPIDSKPTTIWDINNFSELSQGIALADHCYGCTAGSGSSCTGSLN